MVHAESVITISRTPEEVFGFLLDGRNNLRWRPGVLDVEHTSGSGVGEVWRQGVKGPGGRRLAADYQVTEIDRPSRLAFRAVAGPARPEGLYRLEPVDGATQLTFSLSWEPKGLARLLAGPVQRTMTSEVAQLARLKEVLET